MFTDTIKHTYINKSKLIVKDEYGIPLPYEAEICDYANINGNLSDLPDSDYQWDYSIEGFLRLMPNGKHEFIIASPGNCTLYITGIPKSAMSLVPFRMRHKYRNQPLVYSSYWEDQNRGYLFQILLNKIETKNKFIAL